tara:strand:+ start:202 stop:759 length:558 start_codon:yes stop_codon:yes gene_type:complete
VADYKSRRATQKGIQAGIKAEKIRKRKPNKFTNDRSQMTYKPAPRFGEGSPGTDYGKKGGMQPIEKAIDNTIKSKKAANLSTGSSIYNKTKANLNTAYKGKTSMHDINGGKFGHTAKPKGNKVPGKKGVTHGPAVGPSHLTSKNTPSGVNRMDKKKSSSKTPKKHASQTQMRAARRSMGLGKYNW